jgi:hypothetical protein
MPSCLAVRAFGLPPFSLSLWPQEILLLFVPVSGFAQTLRAHQKYERLISPGCCGINVFREAFGVNPSPFKHRHCGDQIPEVAA